VALLLVMVALETRVADPLIPLRFFTNRTRVTSNVVSLALFVAFMGYVVLLTWYMQQVLGYSPLKTGLLWLPLGAGIGAGMGVSTALMPRIGVKAMLAIGLLGSAGGLLAASYIHVTSSYPSAMLPGIVLFGVFSGICYPGLINGALHQVTGQDSGLASGVQTAFQQIGTAVGLATLVTLALRYAGDRIRIGVSPGIAQTDGYAAAFRVGAIVLVAAAVLVLALLERVAAKPRTVLAEVSTDQALAEPFTPAHTS
jgi:MFS family permease